MSRLTYVEQPCKSVLNRVEGMPFKWSINPYTGCSHACTYCYARAFYMRSDRGTAAEFDSKIYVKTNAPAVLQAELSKRSWKRDLVLVGAATDPYQPAEARFRITRQILGALAQGRTPVSIITKSPLVLRDLDLLQQLNQVSDIEVNVTIPTMDTKAWRTMEPGTPPPMARMKMVRKLHEAGIRVGVFMAPILPGISDTEPMLREVIEAAAEAGAAYVMPITLRLAPGVREWFLPHVSKHYPALTVQYCRLYQQTEASKPYKRAVYSLARNLIGAVDLPCGPGQLQKPAALVPEPQQLRLNI